MKNMTFVKTQPITEVVAKTKALHGTGSGRSSHLSLSCTGPGDGPVNLLPVGTISAVFECQKLKNRGLSQIHPSGQTPDQ